MRLAQGPLRRVLADRPAAVIGEMMSNGSPEQIARVTEAFLPMKKLDLAVLQNAYAAA